MGGTLEHLEKEYFRLHKEIVEERLHIHIKLERRSQRSNSN